jgi:hypothetical protein
MRRGRGKRVCRGWASSLDIGEELPFYFEGAVWTPSDPWKSRELKELY